LTAEHLAAAVMLVFIIDFSFCSKRRLLYYYDAQINGKGAAKALQTAL
jgi:hypothetical protein